MTNHLQQFQIADRIGCTQVTRRSDLDAPRPPADLPCELHLFGTHAHLRNHATGEPAICKFDFGCLTVPVTPSPLPKYPQRRREHRGDEDDDMILRERAACRRARMLVSARSGRTNCSATQWNAASTLCRAVPALH